MRKIVSIVLGLIVLIGVVGCTPPPPPPDDEGTGVSRQVTHTQALAAAGLGKYWARQIPLMGEEQLGSVKLLGDSVVLFSSDMNLYSVDAGIGNDRWPIPVKVTDRDEGVFAPTFFPELRITKKQGDVKTILNPPDLRKTPVFDAVLINTYSRFLIINSKTGQVVRDTDFKDFTTTNSGVTDGQRYYVGSSSKHLIAINMLPGVMQWRKDVGEITVPVVVSSDRVFVGTTDGTFSCYTAEVNSKRDWKVSLNGGVKTDFHVDSRGAFVTSDAGVINGLDNRGYPLWPGLHVKEQLTGKMQVGEQTIFQPTTEGLWAVDLTNGKLRWMIKGGQKVLAVMGEIVYVLAADKNMLLVNEVTGDVLFKVSMQRYDLFAANVKIPAIYAGTADGRVICLRQLDAPRLDPEMLK